MIFIGKYRNNNFILKITYYPTLPCEYHKSMIPNIQLEEGHARRVSQVNDPRTTYPTPNSPQAHSYDSRERMSAMSVQPEPSRTKGLSTKSCGYRRT